MHAYSHTHTRTYTQRRRASPKNASPLPKSRPRAIRLISPSLKAVSPSLVKDTSPSSKAVAPSAKAKGCSLKTKLKVGDQVMVTRADGSIVRGQVRFLGKTNFYPGKWVGVALTTPSGKNDGTVRGESYFKCPAKHGLFLRPSQVRALPETTRAERPKV